MKIDEKLLSTRIHTEVCLVFSCLLDSPRGCVCSPELDPGGMDGPALLQLPLQAQPLRPLELLHYKHPVPSSQAWLQIRITHEV